MLVAQKMCDKSLDQRVIPGKSLTFVPNAIFDVSDRLQNGLRSNAQARQRKMVEISGLLPFRIRLEASEKITASIQCCLFSTPQYFPARLP